MFNILYHFTYFKKGEAMERSKKRKISLERAEELKEFVRDYIEARKEIPKGMELQEQFDETKKRILKMFNATEEDWNDWNWQNKHRIEDVEV
jgi:lysine 2,3-aminomutase